MLIDEYQAEIEKRYEERNLCLSHFIKSLPTEQDCMLAGQERKSKLPEEYDKVSYELGFHQAYNWFLSQIYKDNVYSDTQLGN